MFSPYYAWSGRRDPSDHCALNVVLHGPGGNRWTMTERRASALQRDRTNLSIGPSALAWDGTHLTIRIAETGAPWPQAVRGTVRVTPTVLPGRTFTLDRHGRHLWSPIAPRARVEVALDAPDSRWSGSGYLDTNGGTESLEAGFIDWHWSRAESGAGAVVLYDALRRGDDRQTLALRIAADGAIETVAAPPSAALPTTLWRVKRTTLADAGTTPTVIKTLVDAPFYARSLVTTSLHGESLTAVHESLDLTRFAKFWVRCLLPFRMPRIFWQ